MSCETCGGFGEYTAGTRGSCRDDGDGWRYCNCEAGWRRCLKYGGTCFWIAHSGEALLKLGRELTAAEYQRYKDNAEHMGNVVLPNNTTKEVA